MEIPKLELKRLPNGVIVPTKESIILIHDIIIEDRKLLGKNDPASIRNEGLIDHLCNTLTDRLHKYKNNQLEDSLYVATEIFYYIACEHPFVEGNKSTGYVCALFLLDLNLKKGATPHMLDSTPTEAKEIVELAEGGKDPAELRRLIKDFLQKEIGRLK